MTNQEYIIKLQKQLPKINNIIRYFGYHYDLDDVLQDVYVKIMKIKNINSYAIDNEPNINAMFFIIKNIIYDRHKLSAKHYYINIDEVWEDMNKLVDRQYETGEKYDLVMEELEYIDYWFDKDILKLYYLQDHTIRSLSKETKIGCHYIQPIIKQFKIRCQIKYKKIKKLKS